MEPDRRSFAWTEGNGRPDGVGQPHVCQWRVVGAAFRGTLESDLPERYGKYKSVHKRFARWAASGVWDHVFRTLTQDAKNEYLMIDSTIVRAHQQAATGRKKGGRTRLWGVPAEV